MASMSGDDARTSPSEAAAHTGAITAAATGRLLGVVVVGVGRAGLARLTRIPTTAATTEGLQHVRLAGYVSR